jgi:glutaredoxin
MKFIRWILGTIILAWERCFPPVSIKRTPEAQLKAEQALRGIVLYEFLACPFCVKVRRYLKSQGIELPRINAQVDPGRTELLRGGGKVQVPCLRIDQDKAAPTWLYESSDIIKLIQERIQRA